MSGAIKTHTPNPTQVCACQWGPTAWCTNGQHDQCRNHTVTPPETYLTDSPDGDITHHHGTPIRVWLADRTCRWTCPCTCHTEQAPVQETLF